MPALTSTSTGVHLAIKVVPGASRARVMGMLGADCWKVVVSKPPSGGQANDAVVELISEVVGVPRRCVRIEAGHGSPRKTVSIDGSTVAIVQARLEAASGT
ncbi:MAG: DUF167 domain-containing protein [Tepidisphaeraceae bacterium]